MREAAMNCPSCGAPMRLKLGLESFQCDYCQSVHVPEKADDGVRVLDEAEGQACPIYKNSLMNATLCGIRIVYCTKCHGMLVPMPVFEALIDEMKGSNNGGVIQPAADSKDLSRKIACPRCNHRMDAHFYAGPGNVVIDSCDGCLVNWLDFGELTRIAHGPDDRSTAIRQFDMGSPQEERRQDNLLDLINFGTSFL
jgi:Zn-finger nucleic acid-binding protein